ncbi:DUF5590 domain-containing protein [Pseudogracilibacillus sp. SE30717A]|uniref:cell wall elongation regulator TseB-like domain-containing protein n=1 Tax=Pseudogracilibacillus sp. SE30717A TaxID=3098293 RepID=UPI00300E3FA2
MKQINYWLNWKRIFILVAVLLFLLILTFFIYTYIQIEKSKITDGEKTEQFVLNETDLTKIDEIYQFQEKEAFHILLGSDGNGKQSFVFVPLKKSLTKNDLIILPVNDLVSIEQIENEWQKNCSQCTLLHSSPAMIDEHPLWELTYTDHSNRYVIEYISLKDGTTFEQLKLLRKYSKRG